MEHERVAIKQTQPSVSLPLSLFMYTCSFSLRTTNTGSTLQLDHSSSSYNHIIRHTSFFPLFIKNATAPLEHLPIPSCPLGCTPYQSANNNRRAEEGRKGKQWRPTIRSDQVTRKLCLHCFVLPLLKARAAILETKNLSCVLCLSINDKNCGGDGSYSQRKQRRPKKT